MAPSGAILFSVNFLVFEAPKNVFLSKAFNKCFTNKKTIIGLLYDLKMQTELEFAVEKGKVRNDLLYC